jgi:hypothetical protein
MSTRVSTRAPRGRATAFSAETPDLDARIAAAEGRALVVWRGERIPLARLPTRIARTDGRFERDGIYAGWIEALEAVNPLYRERLDRWRAAASAARMDLASALSAGRDVDGLSMELQRLADQSETVYFAALRRYLALIDIEQGDATIADLWHIERGVAWAHWFGDRDVDRAAAAAGRDTAVDRRGDGWRSAASVLGGPAQPAGSPAAAINELYASLVGDPSWLRRALHMAADEIASFADFVAFVRLSHLRRLLALLRYEVRLYRSDDEALERAYYAGIVGHLTGVAVPEAAYLRDVVPPFASAADLERMLLAAMLAERLEHRFGVAWWTDDNARAMTAELAGAASNEDVLAQLGYDAHDWRPVLRQIRTRLIGEMSGYGGPNITTRAGTRKV